MPRSTPSTREFTQRALMAEISLMNQGVTFTVYGDGQGLEKTMPVDLVPRILTHDEWARMERGLVQRLRALNLFLHDVYHDQKILDLLHKSIFPPLYRNALDEALQTLVPLCKRSND